MHWTFLDYVEVDGTNVIEVWLESLPIKAQARVDSRILAMMGQIIWPEGWVSAYEVYDGILEMRITNAGIQYRPLGCYGPEQRQFTLLIGAIEKDGRIAKGILQSAVARRKTILGDRSRARNHQFN